MGEPATRRATRADLEALPEHLIGELIGGVLYTMTRPRARHSNAALGIGAALRDPFQGGRGGPGGWWILAEPGIELRELDIEEIVPDLAGWRRERLAKLPDGPFTIAPDWVCEVLSPSTRAHDLKRKRPLYAKAGVQWMWIVEVEGKTLTASRLHEGTWLEIGTWTDDDVARIEPFHAIELRLSDLWAG